MAHRKTLMQCLSERGVEHDLFEMHLMSEYANENISFYHLCQKLLNKPNFATSSEILENHLIKNCESLVNLPGSLYKALLSDLISIPIKLESVKKASDHVLAVMAGPYQRYKDKNEYKRNGYIRCKCSSFSQSIKIFRKSSFVCGSRFEDSEDESDETYSTAQLSFLKILSSSKNTLSKNNSKSSSAIDSSQPHSFIYGCEPTRQRWTSCGNNRRRSAFLPNCNSFLQKSKYVPKSSPKTSLAQSLTKSNLKTRNRMNISMESIARLF